MGIYSAGARQHVSIPLMLPGLQCAGDFSSARTVCDDLVFSDPSDASQNCDIAAVLLTSGSGLYITYTRQSDGPYDMDSREMFMFGCTVDARSCILVSTCIIKRMTERVCSVTTGINVMRTCEICKTAVDSSKVCEKQCTELPTADKRISLLKLRVNRVLFAEIARASHADQ